MVDPVGLPDADQFWPPDPVGGGGVGTDAACRLVYSPSNPGPLKSNVFASWSLLVAAAQAIEGGGLIVGDPSFLGVPANGVTIPDSSGEPGGRWDLNRFGFTGPYASPSNNAPATVYQFAQDASITNFGRVCGTAALVNLGTHAVILMDSTVDETLAIEDSAMLLKGIGTGPLVQLPSILPIGLLPRLIFDDNARLSDLGGGAARIIELLHTATGIAVVCLGDGNVALADVLSSPNIATNFTVFLSGDNNRQFSRTQSAVAGAATLYRYVDAISDRYTLVTAPISLGIVGAFVATAASAGAVFRLPPAAESAGPIWLDAALTIGGGGCALGPIATDTLEGGPAGTPIPLATGPGAINKVMVKSNGVSAWRVFACCREPGGGA